MTRTALVTGAAGFLGRHVGRHLQRHGWDVLGIDLVSASGGAYKRLVASPVSEVSLQELASDEDVELVVHCAGGASVGLAEKNPEEERAKTIKPTQAVVSWLEKYGRNVKLIYPSSAAVYGGQGAEEQKLKEDDIPSPISNYGRHKLEAEQMILEFVADTSGVTASVIRFFSLYGPELKKQLLWDIVRKSRTEKTIKLMGSGRETRDFIFIEDAVALVEFLAERTTPDSIVVNGATGVATAVADLASGLVTRLCEERREIIFDGEHAVGDPSHLVGDPTKLQGLGFATKIGLEQGLQSYVEWARDQNP